MYMFLTDNPCTNFQLHYKEKDVDTGTITKSSRGTTRPKCSVTRLDTVGLFRYWPTTCLSSLSTRGTTVPQSSCTGHQDSGYMAEQAAIRSFPEYTTKASVPVLGGFAALGNAASFHHPTIREKRGFVYDPSGLCDYHGTGRGPEVRATFRPHHVATGTIPGELAP